MVSVDPVRATVIFLPDTVTEFESWSIRRTSEMPFEGLPDFCATSLSPLRGLPSVTGTKSSARPPPSPPARNWNSLRVTCGVGLLVAGST